MRYNIVKYIFFCVIIKYKFYNSNLRGRSDCDRVLSIKKCSVILFLTNNVTNKVRFMIIYVYIYLFICT